MTTQPPSGLPPSLIMSSVDFNRLDALLDSPNWRHQPAAESLMNELNRAEVLPPEQVPDSVVTMHSTVECVDEVTADRHSLTLVYPHESDVDQGRVSVLAPVGSALLGLSLGQSIDWDGPGGRPLRLRVTAIRRPD